LNCSALFNGDDTSSQEAAKWEPPCNYSDEAIAKIAQNCTAFKQLFHFLNFPTSTEEADFPLAFAIITEKYAEQMVRLLSSIYQPQNLYCLTYDSHAEASFKKAMDRLVKCFPNVLTLDINQDIFWGANSILEVIMDCMKVLWTQQTRHKWTYVQILSWNDIPLKTNLEMVKILKLFNGANDAELIDAEPNHYRYYRTDEKRKLPLPPDGLVMYKGSLAATLARDQRCPS